MNTGNSEPSAGVASALHTREVAGSKPAAPITKILKTRVLRRPHGPVERGGERGHIRDVTGRVCRRRGRPLTARGDRRASALQNPVAGAISHLRNMPLH